MVSSQFGSILKDFERFFNCALQPDANDSCLIQLESGLSVQLEINRAGLLLIGCRLGTLPASRYRDTVLTAALQTNYFDPPASGTLGFSSKTFQLILFTFLAPQTLNPDKIASFLPPFLAKAEQWREALTSGDIPVINSGNAAARPSLFGLKL